MNGRWLAITAMMAWGWGIAVLTAAPSPIAACRRSSNIAE